MWNLLKKKKIDKQINGPEIDLHLVNGSLTEEQRQYHAAKSIFHQIELEQKKIRNLDTDLIPTLH